MLAPLIKSIISHVIIIARHIALKTTVYGYVKKKCITGKQPLDLGAVHTKIDLSWIDLRSILVRFEKVFIFRSILDLSQFAFERSHSDRFGLRSISDRSNSLV